MSGRLPSSGVTRSNTDGSTCSRCCGVSLDELAVEDLDLDLARRDADERRLDDGGHAGHLLELEVDADVHRQVERERADVALVEERVEVDLHVLEVDRQRRRRRRVVADREVDRLLRARHEQQRVVALVALQLGERRHEDADRADVELLDEARADAEAQRRPTSRGGDRRGRASSSRCPSRGRRPDRACRRTRRPARAGTCCRRARGSARRSAARTSGAGSGGTQRRGSLSRSARARRRIFVGVEAGDDAEVHAAVRGQADVAAGDDARFHEAVGAGRDALEQAADVHHALDAERVRQEALDAAG